MPPVTFPPTPGPSTDIKGKEDSSLAPIDITFTLPPSAVNHSPGGPASPPNTIARKSSTAHAPISLPPPPARTRKIIQVKPKDDSEERDTTYVPAAKSARPNTKETGKRKSAAAASGTAAGRKVARKTAHSIIERRRRSKMNEEFSVLKDLIPACRGCEMHKLAILQASIEYLRYLENCVADLKAGRATSSEAPTVPSTEHALDDEDIAEDYENDGPSMDDEMQLDEPQGNATHLQQEPVAHMQPQTSLIRHVEGSHAVSPDAQRHSSTSSTAVSTTALPSPYFGPLSSHSSAAISQATSPIFGPYCGPQDSQSRPQTSRRGSVSYHQHHHHHHWPQTPNFAAQPSSRSHSRTASISLSAQTSPIILAQQQGLNEAEASTALLMLNRDRRASVLARDRRGMSVKDLLTS